ncbi:MAG: S41 family peptidase [Pseudomonadota bacterium]
MFARRWSIQTSVGLLLWLMINAALAQTDAGMVAPPGTRLALVERAIAIGEAAIANPAFVNGEEWNQFKQTIRDPALQTLDDEAFRNTFNEATDALPFTHFRLNWQPGVRSNDGDKPPVVTLSWPQADVALVHIPMFEGDPQVISDTMNRVIERDARALIVDLRGTPGGSFPTAVALSRALRNAAMDAGAFLTRGWFMQHGDYPDASQYDNIAALEVLDLAAFAAQLQRDGAARLVLPEHDQPIFQGQLFILTDGRTASTCEPLVYLLKQHGATVIGERTAGAMLSAEHVPLDETFRLFVPVADYVTPDLTRVDNTGVEPTINVPADQALAHALSALADD